MNYVMIDLETLGVRPDCAFVSLGACFFNPETCEIGNTFYRRIEWNSAMKNRSITPDTLKWWFLQSEAARVEILKQGEKLENVLTDFREWLNQAYDMVVWGNGSTFDISILDNVYEGEPPWKFWNVRDVRTVVDMAESKGIFRRDFPFEGVAHNALDDAIHQAKYVSAMWQALTTNN